MRARVVLALVVACGAPPLCPSAAAQSASPRVVLTIHLGAESFPSNPVLEAGIRDAFSSQSAVKVDYFTEYFETDLFPGDEATQAFADYLRRKYQGRHVDLVIANSDAVARFVLAHRPALFPDVPVVSAGVVVPDERARNAGGGLTGIRVSTAYGATLRLALDLQPSTQRVFVVAKSDNVRSFEAVRAELGAASGGVNITHLQEETVPRLLAAVEAVPAGSIILYLYHDPQDEPGNIGYPDDVARLVARVARVPVYGTSDFYVGTGVVGGVVRSTRDTGTRLGEMAVRILTGTRPQDIPVEGAQVVPVLDWRQVQRWGIAPARVPAGARILFREPSTWDRYWGYILASAAALLAQAMLIGVLLVQRRRRREAEQHVRRSQSALRTSLARVRDLGARLLSAQERERSRIAGELHDDISQQLAALRIHLGRLRRTVQGDAEVVAAEAAKRAEDIAASVHDLSHSLHPARLRLMGLVEALEGLRNELSRPDVTITFTHENVPPGLSPDLRLCLFRIVQEALQNALKHSQAHHVSVELRGDPEGVTLTIGDDGVGFDVDAMWGKGLGLLSVHERVEAVGGTFHVRSTPGAGTRLEIRLPEGGP